MSLKYMINAFKDGGPSRTISALVGEKRIFNKEHFVSLAKKQYGDYSFADKIKIENVKEIYCRYNGINCCYILTGKGGRGSFPVYYIDV
ncbi:MAG: hypothetical protein ACOCWG_05685 [bacterium]